MEAFLKELGQVVGMDPEMVACTNDIGRAVKEYADAGKMVPNYDYDPDDHYSVLGAVMQKYLTGNIGRNELAAEIEKYWASAKRVEH